MYPSVTVCKKYTFDSYLDDLFENKDINLTEVKELVIAYSWDKYIYKLLFNGKVLLLKRLTLLIVHL